MTTTNVQLRVVIDQVNGLSVTVDHIRGTAAEFTASNPVLGFGVFGYETDTERGKFGDGTTAYNSLSYFAGSASWASLSGVPATFPPSTHSHIIGDVTGLQAALDGKQAAGSYVATTDPRLSDAREWSASTVTQAAAEAGTDTVRVAWTVQRVWQAIAAWWAASAAKTKLDGIATGATANQTDAYLLSRANHTGTQPHTTITGLGTLATQSGTVSGVNTGDQTITLTGDVTGSGTGSFVATLASSGVTAGTYTSVTVDAKGRVTAGSSPAVAYSSLSGIPSTFTPASHTHGNITNVGAIGVTSGLPIITTTSGVLTVGAFGVSAGQFCQGNDSRLSDARTPTSHVHGNITNAGAIGVTSGLPIITTTSGVLTVGAFGVSAGQFCQGNDSRLSDARTPTSHVHGNITNAGAIGSTSGMIVVTTTGGVLTTATIGSGLSLSGGTLSATGGGGGGTGVTDGNKGDITVSGSGTVWTINSSSVTDADIVAMSASKLTGTIDNARLSDEVNMTTDLYLWSSFR
jgi:hypothetical protein